MYVIDIIDVYGDTLPSPLHFNDEVIRWKRRWTTSEVSAGPYKIAKAIKTWWWNVSKFFLRFLEPLRLLHANEKSGSVLKRLNTYLRASMGQGQMSGLAFIYINHDKDIDVARVLKTFWEKPSALQFTSIY